MREKNKKILKYILASIPLTVIYYILLANILYFGKDAQLLKANRIRAKILDSIELNYTSVDSSIKVLQARDGEIYRMIFGAQPLETLYDEESGEEISIERATALASEVQFCIDSIKGNLAYLGSSARNIPSVVPVENFHLNKLGASMGKKVNPFLKSVVWHPGLDIHGEIGDMVLAAGDGVVEKASTYEDKNEGRVLIINHLNGYRTKYAHLDEILVKVNDTVKVSQRVATVGSTGRSLTPHLHYEVILGQRHLNPSGYFFGSLQPAEYSRAIHISENSGHSLD